MAGCAPRQCDGVRKVGGSGLLDGLDLDTLVRQYGPLGLDRRASRALVGDAPASTGGRAPGGRSAPVSGGAGVADWATGEAKGVAYICRRVALEEIMKWKQPFVTT